MSLEEYLNHDEPHRFMIDEQVPWQDIISKKSKARRKAGSKRAKKKRKGKRDACYYKVKARYKCSWPSAYASGALVQCRKVGASNWGESTKKSWEDTIKGGDNFAREKKEGLHGWFQRRGGKGKAKGWVDCGSCGKKDGPKPCGRKDASKGRKRRCRPTCAACKTYKRRKGSP